MIIETSRGPIEAARLERRVERCSVAVGELVTTTHLLGDEVVKIDQHLDISEDALVAAGIGRIT